LGRAARDYKTTIPELFWYNAIVTLSNGIESRVGSVTADWGHFADWKKIDAEGERGVISLETTIRGTCAPSRLLDLVENFTLFGDVSGGVVKVLAKNHQYLGVNAAFRAVQEIGYNQGRLGVFWHTQGSGKSYSMIFFSQKVLRKLPGNWTFVVVTDRQELDKQIYGTFAGFGAVVELERQVHANSGDHLKTLLGEDHRYVFTLIQKFHAERGQVYPTISERSDVIVMTDEAHRSQYDLFALNLRNALPKAAFIGFTGTPLMAGEQKTRQVFGNYVSVYNFKQSVDDGATVPLYYENRIPELQLVNPDLNEKMEDLLEAAELDEDQEAKLEREFAREYHLITRDDRLEKVAEDLVAHFLGRGYRGKAMVVSIDRITAVRMYEKVQKYWATYLAGLRTRLVAIPPAEQGEVADQIQFIESTDLAVVISSAQNEVSDFQAKGLDVRPHRRRLLNEDLESKFKDPNDPFRIVFVCAMWMTGFDVPACSTIYLDKPMRNHTLMQTIARANRVFPDKVNGLIVDYVGVFRNLKRALAIYGSLPGGAVGPDELPVVAKIALVSALRKAIDDASSYCSRSGIDVGSLLAAGGYQQIRLIDDAVEAILVSPESKRTFLALADDVDRFFRAVLPDRAANEFIPRCRSSAFWQKPFGTGRPTSTCQTCSARSRDFSISRLPRKVMSFARIWMAFRASI
jgi:type I restriction enzyme, R subunit